MLKTKEQMIEWLSSIDTYVFDVEATMTEPRSFHQDRIGAIGANSRTQGTNIVPSIGPKSMEFVIKCIIE